MYILQTSSYFCTYYYLFAFKSCGKLNKVSYMLLHLLLLWTILWYCFFFLSYIDTGTSIAIYRFRNICNHYAGNSWVFSAEEKRVCHHQSDWLNSLAVWEIVHGGRYLKIQTPSPTNFRISFVNIAMHHWKKNQLNKTKQKTPHAILIDSVVYIWQLIIISFVVWLVHSQSFLLLTMIL